MPLGSCIVTWNKLQAKEEKMRTELAAQRSAPIPYGSTLWGCPHLILHQSHRLVLRWSHWWVDPLDSEPCRWDLPSGVELYPPSLGSTLRCWALPLVLVCPPPRLRRWALPSAVPSSLGSAFRRWVITFVVGPCRCGICYASVVVHHPHSSSSLFSTPPLAGIAIVGAPPCGWACWVRVCDVLCVLDGWVVCMLVRRTCDYWVVGVVDGWWCG